MTEPETLPTRRPSASVVVPWLIVILLLIVLGYIACATEITCHFSGDMLSPAARLVQDKKDAAKSVEGIAVNGDSEPPAVVDKKDGAKPLGIAPSK